MSWSTKLCWLRVTYPLTLDWQVPKGNLNIDRTDSFLNKSNWAWDLDMGLWRCVHQNPDCNDVLDCMACCQRVERGWKRLQEVDIDCKQTPFQPLKTLIRPRAHQIESSSSSSMSSSGSSAPSSSSMRPSDSWSQLIIKMYGTGAKFVRVQN